MLLIDGVEYLIQLLLHVGDTTGIVAGNGVHQIVTGMHLGGGGLIRLTEELVDERHADVLTAKSLTEVAGTGIVIHLDADLVYTRQGVKNGKIALGVRKLLRETDQPSPSKEHPADHLVNTITCHNPRCITNVEQELDQVFYPVNLEHGIYRCLYCEEKAKYTKA